MDKHAEAGGCSLLPIYQLRHAFCTRMEKAATDAVLTQAMRHSSPETKRDYLLGMHEDVREAMDEANREFFGEDAYHIFSTVTEKRASEAEEESLQAIET
ncbi:MAG TPA: hypothetical protein VFZ27_02700 [Terriglobia bacterium]|nr:hypothetical protein [Terriglobia bacterium]